MSREILFGLMKNMLQISSRCDLRLRLLFSHAFPAHFPLGKREMQFIVNIELSCYFFGFSHRFSKINFCDIH